MTATGIALSSIKAALSGVPVLGGPLASLLGDALQAHTDRAQSRALELLGARLDGLQERVDLGAVDRDELAELFKSCYLVIVRTHHEVKLRAATSLLANLLLRVDDPERLSYTELDHFARCIDGLSIGAIEALGRAFDMARSQVRSPHNGPFRFNFEDLTRGMPDQSPDLLMGLVGELSTMNLLHLAGVPSVRTTEYGNYPLELTPLGIRFVTRLVMSEPAGSPIG